VGKAKRAPAQRSVINCISSLNPTGPSLQKHRAVFVASARRYAGAGARFALPTFPTCKFAELERKPF